MERLALLWDREVHLPPELQKIIGRPSRAVILNWWVPTQKWVADPFSVGRRSLPGQ